MSSPWPSINRPQLLSAATESFTHLRGAILYGEAGVGKSQLASDIRETLDREAPDRYVWYSVTGSHVESAIPLSAIDGLLSEVDAEDQRPPRRIAELVHSRLTSEASSKHVALLVDDAHLLDVSSAEVLAHLCRLGGVHLLCAIRSGHTQADALVRLWRDDLLGRVDVPLFTADEVGEAVWAALGGPVDSALVRELFRSSEGNPMYVRELVRAGTADGSIVQRHGIWIREGRPKTADRIIDLVTAELERLSDRERAAVELIALAEPVSSALARPLIDTATLDQLVDAGLVRVEEVPDQGQLTDPSLRLSHPIYSECVRSTISPPARHEWYAKIYRETPPAPHHTLSGFLRWTAWTLECGLEIAATDLVRAARAASSLGQSDFALEAATAAFERSVDTQTAVDALTIRSRELYYSDLPIEALRDADAALRLLRATPLTVDERVADAILKLHELRADIQQFGLDDPAAALETIDRFFRPLVENGERTEHVRRHAGPDGQPQLGRRSRHPAEGRGRSGRRADGELDAAPPVMVALTWAGRTTEAMALAAHYDTVTIPEDPTSMRAGANLRFAALMIHLVSGRLESARACAPDPLSINDWVTSIRRGPTRARPGCSLPTAAGARPTSSSASPVS
ncbi:AAA family ATPase [Aeromicrobium sp. UC242_57]|uniref:AAA family ATPase n=1 Tax=Aeromicrobium sp. UC242_57 TaxID=3374624 RepID=UPI00379B6443